LLGLFVLKDFFLTSLKKLIALGYDRPWELNLHNLSRVTFFSLLTFLFFSFLADRKISPKLGQIGVAFLLLADLFLGNWGQYKYVDRQEFYKPGPNLQIVLSDPSLFRVYTDVKVLKSVIFTNKDKSLTSLFFQERFSLDYTTIHHIYNVSGFPILVYRPVKDLLSLLESSPYPQATDLLRIFNVKYLLWPEPLNDPSFKLLRKGDLHLSPQEESKPVPDRPPPYKPIVPLLYENQKVLPRAYLAKNFRVVPNDKGKRDLITTKSFDPVQTVLLEEVPVWPRSSKGLLPNDDSLRILKYSLNQIQLTASCGGSRLLFLSETYYPGWKVWVDGKREKIYRANHAFRAVALSQGHHTITFSYQPFSFYFGLVISSLTFLGLLVFLIFFRKKSLWKINQEEFSCPPVT
jgi:Bacterial membrane protein YfhO